MVAPPFGDTGGPEVVVQNLTDALLKRNKVDVTLFAPADWKTKAKHIATLEKSLWNMKDFKDQTKAVRNNLIVSSQIKILNYQNKFDIAHLHSMGNAYAVAKNLNIPVVLTTHNSIQLDRYNLFKSAKNIHLVSISKSNKENFKTVAIINNGLPVKNVPFSNRAGDYLITVGRIVSCKGIDESIMIARKAKKKLLIIGRIGLSPQKKDYYNKYVNPYIDNINVIHINEASHKEVYEYLKKSLALLFTPRWEEPFGMVAIEALATGTPVIGYKRGALKEIITKRKIGYLSNNKQNITEAINNIGQFDRQECRRYAQKYFDSAIMADKYITLYKKILRRSTK